MTVGRQIVDDNGATDVADETKTTDAVGIPYDGSSTVVGKGSAKRLTVFSSQGEPLEPMIALPSKPSDRSGKTISVEQVKSMTDAELGALIDGQTITPADVNAIHDRLTRISDAIEAESPFEITQVPVDPSDDEAPGFTTGLRLKPNAEIVFPKSTEFANSLPSNSVFTVSHEEAKAHNDRVLEQMQKSLLPTPVKPTTVSLGYLLSHDEISVIDAWMLLGDFDGVARRVGKPIEQVRAILRRTPVKDEIQRRYELSSVSAAETVHHLGELARFSPGRFDACYETKNGKRVFSLAKAQELGIDRFIERIDTDAFGNDCVRWYSRAKALDGFAKVHGLNRESVSHTLTVETVRQLSDEELNRKLAEIEQ